MMTVRFALTLLTALFVATIAFAHPADGYSPTNTPPSDVKANPSNITGSFGELTFDSCELTVVELTPTELYIVYGVSDSSYGTGNALLPWYHEVFMIANAIKSHTGSLPSQLSVEAISEATGHQPDVSRLEHFKSPITGEFPRLDAVDFAPGQVYMRELTEVEMRDIAQQVPEYQQLWFDGVVVDPETSEIVDYVELLSPVYYIRVYGEQGVLVETLKFLLKSNQKPLNP